MTGGPIGTGFDGTLDFFFLPSKRNPEPVNAFKQKQGVSFEWKQNEMSLKRNLYTETKLKTKTNIEAKNCNSGYVLRTITCQFFPCLFQF